MYRLIPLTLFVTLTFLPSIHARRIPNWPYDRLLKEADVVVIATPQSSKDTKEVSRDNSWKTDFLGVETQFAVQAVLKGEIEGKQFTLFHYRLPAGVRVESGPSFVAFPSQEPTRPPTSGQMKSGPLSYLLFLKQRKDGRFEAVSGQIDPVLSVQEMHRPRYQKATKKEKDK